MEQNNSIQEELQSIGSPLADMPKDMPYLYPDGYFEQLASILTNGLKASSSDDAELSVDTTLPFAVPGGYFQSLPAHLLSTAVTNSIDSGIANPYQAPDEYLNTLPATLLTAAKAGDLSQSKPKVIALGSQWRRAVQWAAAAVLVLGIGLGSYRYIHPVSPESKVAKQLAKVDGDAIQDYVLHHVDEFDEETLEASIAVNAGVNTTLSTLNEDEIRAYLDENGWEEKESTN